MWHEKEVYFFTGQCVYSEVINTYSYYCGLENMKCQKFDSCLVYEFLFLKICGEVGEISFLRNKCIVIFDTQNF